MGLIRALMVALLLHSAQVILCHPIPHNDTDECSTVSSRSMIREVSTRMRDLISGVYLMPTKEVSIVFFGEWKGYISHIDIGGWKLQQVCVPYVQRV